MQLRVMKMDVVTVATLLFAVLQAAAAFQWSPSPENGQIIHACTGQDVTIAWDYSVGPGDTITSIQWTYDGRSQEIVAASVAGNFSPTPAFANRVQHVPEAGLRLAKMIKDDTGNYSVQVEGHDSAGVSFTQRRTVFVQVAENLMTTDHSLHASQQLVAEYNNVTDQWHGVLVCGNFTYRDEPPSSVEWMTPQGKAEPSSYYKDGFFHYLVPNPVREGTYTCRIPQQALPASCVHGNSQEAQVVVDGLQIRMAVMEASNTALTKKVATLEIDNRNLTEKVATLETDNRNLKSDNLNLTQLVQNMRNEMAFAHIAFRATMSGLGRFSSGETLILRGVPVNLGNGYDPSTGRFTAPLDGVYFFSVVAATSGTDAPANVYMTSTIQSRLVYSFARGENSHPQTGSGQAVVHLRQGDQVWLVSNGAGYFRDYEMTVFTGFLIFAD